jgi:hypothetical protein
VSTAGRGRAAGPQRGTEFQNARSVTLPRPTVRRRTGSRRGRRGGGAALAACAALALSGCSVALTPAASPGPRSLAVTPDRPLGAPPSAASGSLARALAAAGHGPVVLQLAPGHYVLEPAAYVDPACGNCEDPSETVPTTLGLRVSGTGVVLRGSHADSVVIHTGAGYGVLFEDCAGCALSGVTVTGGARSPDGRATDAGIVVRRSDVVLERCAVRDNVGDSATVAATVVGIAGIAGREGSDLTVRGCSILRNSWDGIALYRGARATITDNVIDGVDAASGARVGGGRGVGIGMTWDARATVERNLVRRYWKGIGVFVDADATLRENVVEDVLTWGIALWGPGDAAPSARIERNAVHGTGACGVFLDLPAGRGTPGSLVDNLVLRTGRNPRYDPGEPYCWQRPIARHRVPPGFVESGNLLHDNRQPPEAGSAPPPEQELARDAFLESARGLVARLARIPALAGARLFGELPELR